MEKNIGTVDKVVRIILAVVFAYLGYTSNYLWYILAVILLVTALIGYCGLYKLIGVNTCKM